ncbi:MAG TPA: hypothetical protein DCE41_06315 [Cytophagales bacterium]|nr:hypothetical protein [Cytophagales bacterium]HAA19565.1 hypothetical protein [Cytophagales bacterium]HAP62479.1 hypothetical protein [Cytophagales bacterium]
MFSICIPNYNYEKYLGETLDTIFAQTDKEFEVVLADNQSTDSSVAIMEDYAKRYPNQVRFKINATNLGFAGNLDQAGSLAEQPYMIMLSSDDTMAPTALARYRQLIEKLPEGEKFIITSAKQVIDGESQLLETVLAKDMARKLWRPEDTDASLTDTMGVPVYKVAAKEMLRRCIQHMANPYNFLCTLYPKSLYAGVGGYGASRMINPDKWFHWRLTGAAEYVYFVDEPLFQYRWHAANQSAQQANSGHLKFLADEYRTTIEAGPLLKTAEMDDVALRKSFVQWDIIRHGLGELSKGYWLKSWRILHMGLGMYPKWVIRNRAFFPYLILLGLGPVGSALLRIAKK